MAGVVPSEDTNYEEMCANFEQMELDDVATGEVFTQLLAIYLLQNDICNAKFLWKRISDETKNSTPELASLWNIGCNLWKRDFPGIYRSLKQSWSPTVQPFITVLEERQRERAFNLVASAYTSIRADDFASFTGMEVETAVNVATSSGWAVDSNTGMLLPKKREKGRKDISITNEQELALLTDYVSFLEN